MNRNLVLMKSIYKVGGVVNHFFFCFHESIAPEMWCQKSKVSILSRHDGIGEQDPGILL